MRIATWNINSVRTRVDRVRAFLERSDVDVLCLQETKCTDQQFPDFTDLGYEQAHVGFHAFNGVAILSRVGLTDVRTSFGQPGFDKDWTAPQPLEARSIGANCGGVEVWSLYVPNGREISDPHYTYKLAWLEALAGYSTAQATNSDSSPLVVVGDFNIAPRDADVWDTAYFQGKTHVTPRERAALEALKATGLQEATELVQDQFTYWDYQALRFQKGEGIRIDLQYCRGLEPVAARVDVAERKGKGASDHAPVIVDYADASGAGDHPAGTAAR